jgi:hypothetical protein
VCRCSVTVKRPSQLSGVVPLLACEGYVLTVKRLPVGIPAGITVIKAFEDEPAFIQRSILLEKHMLQPEWGIGTRVPRGAEPEQ